MKHYILLFVIAVGCLVASCTHRGGTDGCVSQEEMQQVYESVKTPYKYGLVVVGDDAKHMTDSPTLFRHDGRWYMTYIVFEGEGYHTNIAVSDDLLHWTSQEHRVIGYKDYDWDMMQQAGYVALVDIDWGGSYEAECYDGRLWMTYLGGNLAGYETKPLHIGLAYASPDSVCFPWHKTGMPILSPHDSTAQWFEAETQYKSTVFRDRDRRFDHDFVMFYNAFGVNPDNGIGAERIGIALSDDMMHWTRYEGNPVVAHEEEGTISGDAHIQRVGDLYVMFYFRAFDSTRTYLAYNTFACSRDLVHWYDWQGDDLIYPTEDYDARYAHKSCIVNWRGVTYHFYCAVDEHGHRGIALATSADMGRSEVSFPTVE